MWQELDHYQNIVMKCLDVATALNNFIVNERLYDFLASLNPEFDQVRIQILGRDDLPSLKEATSLVHAEES